MSWELHSKLTAELSEDKKLSSLPALQPKASPAKGRGAYAKKCAINPSTRCSAGKTGGESTQTSAPSTPAHSPQEVTRAPKAVPPKRRGAYAKICAITPSTGCSGSKPGGASRAKRRDAYAKTCAINSSTEASIRKQSPQGTRQVLPQGAPQNITMTHTGLNVQHHVQTQVETQSENEDDAKLMPIMVTKISKHFPKMRGPRWREGAIRPQTIIVPVWQWPEMVPLSGYPFFTALS